MRVLLSCGVLSVVIACGGPSPEARLEPHVMSSRALKFAQLSTAIPAFGGFRNGPSGEWIVFTRDASRVGDTEAEITRIFGKDSTVRFEVAVRPERGTASEQWKEQSRQVLAHGAPGLDYDELTGYLRIFVAEPEDGEAVEQVMIRDNVPVEMSIVQVASPAVAY